MTSDKKLILLIEDDESVRTLVHRALSTQYQVETAPDGMAGFVRLQKQPVPDLLICDIMMPGLDGLGVAKRARSAELTKQMPIIFLTAKATPMNVIQGIQAGARNYITKPFKLDDLMQKVRKVLGA
jgi:DNA-binding response OmpR family regulator